MEIRLKIYELIILMIGLIFIGTAIGLTLAGIFSTQNGVIYSLMALFPVLSIINRKRIRV